MSRHQIMIDYHKTVLTIDSVNDPKHLSSCEQAIVLFRQKHSSNIGVGLLSTDLETLYYNKKNEYHLS